MGAPFLTLWALFGVKNRNLLVKSFNYWKFIDEEELESWTLYRKAKK